MELLPDGKVLAGRHAKYSQLGDLQSEHEHMDQRQAARLSIFLSTLVKKPDLRCCGLKAASLRWEQTAAAAPGILRFITLPLANGRLARISPMATIWPMLPPRSCRMETFFAETSPGVFNPPVTFYEFNGTKFLSAPLPKQTGNLNTSYLGRLLVLPTGQILYTLADGATIDAEIYTAKGTYQKSWAPAITTAPSTITRGDTYKISGTQFNGLTHGAAYGDDAQMNSSYGLVRITNNASKHVIYARTHNPSTMGVATGTKVVSTNFDVPAGAETGASSLVVVANGIPSAPVSVTVQ